MFKFFLGNVALALGLMTVAQWRGWSVMPTTASEFERRKADQVEQASRPSWSSSSSGGSSSGGFSGK